jgi:hypothetical protein
MLIVWYYLLGEDVLIDKNEPISWRLDEGVVDMTHRLRTFGAL